MIGILRDLLAPPVCLGCAAPGHDLCPRCRRTLVWSGPSCRRCGLPACPGGRRCAAAGQAFVASWAPLAYAGPVPAIVGALKQRRSRIAAEPMVAAMAQPPAWLLADASEHGSDGQAAQPTLVPVPTAAARVRSRGFDQAGLLAAGLAARGLGPAAACLQRSGPASRQRGAGRSERLAPDRLAISVRPDVAVPTSCVLVDDVHTTGATFDACARALRAGGAKRVAALAYARALP